MKDRRQIWDRKLIHTAESSVLLKDWDSNYGNAEADFADCLVEDHKIRTFLKKRLYSAGISRIEIERASDRVKVIVHTAKPGVVIGKGRSRDRKAERRSSEADRQEAFHRYQRSKKTRQRCSAGSRVHRTAA